MIFLDFFVDRLQIEAVCN